MIRASHSPKPLHFVRAVWSCYAPTSIYILMLLSHRCEVTSGHARKRAACAELTKYSYFIDTGFTAPP